jgi:hypothetical protein
MPKVLRILTVVVGVAFVLLLIVGFDNMLALLRSRVALFLVLGPVVGLFIWSVYMAFRPKKDSGRVVDIPPPEK